MIGCENVWTCVSIKINWSWEAEALVFAFNIEFIVIIVAFQIHKLIGSERIGVILWL